MVSSAVSQCTHYKWRKWGPPCVKTAHHWLLTALITTDGFLSFPVRFQGWQATATISTKTNVIFPILYPIEWCAQQKCRNDHMATRGGARDHLHSNSTLEQRKNALATQTSIITPFGASALDVISQPAVGELVFAHCKQSSSHRPTDRRWPSLTGGQSRSFH